LNTVKGLNAPFFVKFVFMNQLLTFFCIIALPLMSWSQIDATIELDSLTINYKTGGSLDSVDRISVGFSNSFIPNFSDRNFQFIQADYFLNPEKGILFSTPKIENQLLFSALPHIGFSYVFGTQGTQLLNFNFQQALKYNFIVNAAIKRNQSVGFFRNSALKNNQYDLKVGKIGKIYSVLLSGIYSNQSNAWNGGIEADSLAVIYASGLIPVRKENALSNSTSFVFNLKNHLKITGDSINFIRLNFVNQYCSQKRFYAERDSLSNLYPSIYIDSLQTNDTLTTNRSSNNLSLLLRKNGFNFEAGASFDYWNYKSFGLYRDTIEIGLFEQLSFKWKGFEIKQHGNLNLVGAGRGFGSTTSISFPFLKGVIALNHFVNYCYPELYQRHFYSNNTIYQLASLNLQKRQQLKLEVKNIIGINDFGFYYQLMNYKDNYFYDSNQFIWRNDLAISTGVLHQVSVKKSFKAKQIYFSPSYTFNGIKEKFRLIPMHQLNARLQFKGGIFKAKKLQFACGFDVSYHSKFKNTAFIPQMALLDLTSSTTNSFQKSLLNVSFFSSFEVETFHFFVRADNFAYFWSDKTTTIIEGYTLPSLQVKIGITWDFWN